MAQTLKVQTLKFAFLAAALLAAAPAFSSPSLSPPSPTVVELFQSQGCSSCPPAIANVNALASRPDILALDFAVTYWDRLGWKDTFATPGFTARQWDYAHGLHHANVYTPQILVNGARDLVGADRAELDRAVRQAPPLRAAPSIAADGGAVTIGAGPADVPGDAPADIWLVRYDPRTINVAIGAGENSGITLAHRNVVRELTRLGGWSGATERFTPPPPRDPAWRTAILVQAAKGGAILSARNF